MNRPDFISLADWQILTSKYPENLASIVHKIEDGYPIQYLIGSVEFLNTTINVDERVLIPRFETEYLVDKTIKYANQLFKSNIKIIDLGTGSGCIAIALKKNLNAHVDAIDISLDALEVAKKNALLNNTIINFKHQSITDPLLNTYDIIISNPPYISPDGYVADGVRKYEPHLALFAPNNGIYYYQEILAKHLNKLNKPGLMAFEIGDNEEELLEHLLKQYPQLKYEFFKDMQGLTRYLFIFNE